jgi:hypothetical protein
MMTVTIFAFVPGREWMMTTADASDEQEMKERAEEFARFCGRDWTELRVYVTPPMWTARPANSVQWSKNAPRVTRKAKK